MKDQIMSKDMDGVWLTIVVAESLWNPKQENAMIHLTNENFKTELHSSSIVLIDFWTTWCGPCRQMEPVLKIAESKHPSIKFCKAEVEECKHYFEQYDVTRVPMFILFKDGQIIDKKTGLIPEKELNDWLTEKGK